jgi:predicted metal-dependent HD superfamily phosphohydrolase
MDYLGARWQKLWLELGSKAPAGAYGKVIAAYSEGHRHYHDIDHIINSLELFDWYRFIPQAPAVLELSIWLHDVVYDVRATDNEARSADFAEALLRKAGLDSLVAPTRGLIESTAHSGADLHGDAAFLSDIDLAVLGSRQHIYNAYCTAIKKEYSWVPNDVYSVKRAEVMEKFIKSPFIYYTPEFQRQFEKNARRNIKAELIHLRR